MLHLLDISRLHISAATPIIFAHMSLAAAKRPPEALLRVPVSTLAQLTILSTSQLHLSVQHQTLTDLTMSSHHGKLHEAMLQITRTALRDMNPWKASKRHQHQKSCGSHEFDAALPRSPGRCRKTPTIVRGRHIAGP